MENNAVSGLARAGIGALATHFLAPKPHMQQPISAHTLNQATIPLMQRDVNRRMAAMLASQGARGGQTASDIFERNNMQNELQQRVAQQHALNQISANQAYNNAVNYNNQARLQNYLNLLGGGLAGFSLPRMIQNNQDSNNG